MTRRLVIATLVALIPALAWAQNDTLSRTVEITDWKAVFGRIEARDQIPARSRLGGTLVEVSVVEGMRVTAGQQIARVVDEKLALELNAIDASLESLNSQLANAEAELARGQTLLERGVTTTQRLDSLRTQVDVILGQIGTAEAERNVLEQREEEGAVLAPIEGTVLTVPVTAGSVVMPGEAIATIGGGGFFLRLAVPERHAMNLEEGDTIRIEGAEGEQEGRLVKIYPQIENGRVIADVEVPGLETDFVDARVLVRLPVATSSAVVVPANSLSSRMGLDFVTITGPDGTPRPRTVVVGTTHSIDGETVVEILSGLNAGEQLVTNRE
ncbi:efflux RND transporter periplasmic adaptor subunit [Lutimaribacter sp. EGI FJ00015]|uniref:Efflux RND transporter periplasmic adaptor subunit n=1 Tax=Lutimaribacter degradans TaxID=2945989 RepID=A0ACC5ZVP2_9RHOB|nr:efflux RND transporter periplasmic adaptor subunit [Lutimaribacter sp. EGI FJ00013]MCM2562258.1 efflux RND transporter periplasmic adaptor subunit [Lutimaribacter sp. EGI FJ00013]MCO0613413.1 efflux RND transporter periplasmic adaptor subunit [Lutimaribacter sp. EGI FJ00015]MCO0636387.1 efflux RND transporter periplasmic adaptor subunit [Lutimaribacter sp. EGI FJ00014]